MVTIEVIGSHNINPIDIKSNFSTSRGVKHLCITPPLHLSCDIATYFWMQTGWIRNWIMFDSDPISIAWFSIELQMDTHLPVYPVYLTREKMGINPFFWTRLLSTLQRLPRMCTKTLFPFSYCFWFFELGLIPFHWQRWRKG